MTVMHLSAYQHSKQTLLNVEAVSVGDVWRMINTPADQKQNQKALQENPAWQELPEKQGCLEELGFPGPHPGRL